MSTEGTAFPCLVKRRASMIAFMPQRAAFPPGLRVRDLLSMGRYPHSGWIDIPRQQECETVERWARELGIEPLRLQRRPGAERPTVGDAVDGLTDRRYPGGAAGRAGWGNPDWDNTHRMFQILRRTLVQEKKAAVIFQIIPKWRCAGATECFDLVPGQDHRGTDPGFGSCRKDPVDAEPAYWIGCIPILIPMDSCAIGTRGFPLTGRRRRRLRVYQWRCKLEI